MSRCGRARNAVLPAAAVALLLTLGAGRADDGDAPGDPDEQVEEAADLPVGCDAQEADWRPVWETTREERLSADPRRHDARGDVLVLPFPAMVDPAEDLPEWFLDRSPHPRFAEKGDSLAAGRWRPWRVVARKPLHEEYLTTREEFLAKGDVKGLVKWCERKKLRSCLLFETRQMLGGRGAGTAYRRWNAIWKKHSGHVRTPHSFPLPVQGEWLSVPAAHHRASHWSMYAMDLVRLVGGRSSRNTGADNRDYYSWNQPVMAQADGVVVDLTDGTPDTVPGRPRADQVANGVTVDYGGVRVTYAHLRRGSVEVEKGQEVRVGELLGRVGNSGMTTAPHLHLVYQEPGGFAVRPRFTCEVRRPPRGKWKRMDGGDLRENWSARNLSLVKRAPPRRRGPR